ncbi:MAG: iron-sulfur cluster assembly scaffold protein [Sulfurovum sp.]|nr:iron-sulfur cluster assembly scaffold protein [Sulfurovum sp.]MCB4744755.1 iron-sulfur cluster assembly scaffold protein [Sulfurovum sp.]MCB4746954.1 iron-sulfur cluster assembly scaffold protein [Sulfurovum sp.]MCB4748130.1 iron-sulfur cluster assembly scaffold protein [Sulfurovum sp.]MCB4749267.1 iron-sulfur cluster assembly scaffold protein [Sulfurovum sp.]
MGIDNLVGGTIWDEYSNKVTELMNNPKNMGEITEKEAEAMGAKLIVADFGAESCGDAVRLYWAVDTKTDVIKESKFKSFGCGTAIASSDTMAELCRGKTVDEAIKITNIDVEKAMRDEPNVPAVPPQKMHCSVMAYDVIKKAAAQYKGVDIDSFEEEIIVCECARVSLSTLREVIRLNDLTTVEQITDYTKAGAFCKSCIKPGGHEEKDIYLVDLLEEYEKEKIANAATLSNGSGNFKSMTIVQKIKAVDKVIDENIRQMLIMDGGDMEILDIKDNEEHIDIYIRYLGACNGCASASTGTLFAIENILKEKLDSSIRVLPI